LACYGVNTSTSRAALDLYRQREVTADSEEAERFRVAHAIAWPRLARPFTSPPVDLSIRYLGVWDTVGSLGIPRLLPISIGMNAEYEFHDTALSRCVEHARHAVAIDERRAPFTPTLWNNIDSTRRAHARASHSNGFWRSWRCRWRSSARAFELHLDVGA
jgi:hypothetical protein